MVETNLANIKQLQGKFSDAGALYQDALASVRDLTADQPGKFSPDLALLLDVLAFMMLAGFESATTLGEKADAATRTIPLLACLLPIGLLFLVSIYAITALAHHRDLGLDQSSAPLDVIAQSIGLPALGWMSSLRVALSCFGCALGGFNSDP